MESVTVFACESQPIVLEGLRCIFSACQDLTLVGQASDPAEAVRGIARLAPQLVLLADFYPAKPLLPLSLQIREQFPGTSVILWMVDFSDADRLRALQVGVKGVLQKTQPVDAILRCLRAVARGEVWLGGEAGERRGAAMLHRDGNPRITPREREIISLVAKGLKNKEIGAALTITAGTVKVHLMHIFEKTGVKDRFQLALQSQELLGKGDQLASSDMVEVFQS